MRGPTVTFALAAAIAAWAALPAARAADNNAGKAPDRAAGLAAWERIAPVFNHPRCANCHQPVAPTIGETGRTHLPRVLRGPDNMGVGAMRCQGCHNESGNAPASGVPGAPRWSLAPASIGWGSLSPALVCRNLTDRSRNGDMDPARLLLHFHEDKLVEWAWAPGGDRAPVPMARAEFLAAAKAWTEAGAPCPE